MRWTAEPASIEEVQSNSASAQNSSIANKAPHKTVLVCFSHLRWRFVYQRPQHLMSRFATTYQVLFFEEAVFTDIDVPWLEKRLEGNLQVLVPHLPEAYQGAIAIDAQRNLLDEYLAEIAASDIISWYYTPMSLPYSDHLQPRLTVYDCMDELSAFRGAPPSLVEQERRLIEHADLIFTGGISLFEAKRQLHDNVHPFPSSVDIAHFGAARKPQPEPEDQASLPRPRLGFFGVIDERLDIALLEEAATQRPEWQFILVGPVVKIDPETLPKLPNIHYLGSKSYAELPQYLASWDVALMPFALNESTRFISPTKTPEYLAGGRLVVSTPITDVIRTYGDSGVVKIAQTPEEFIKAIEESLKEAPHQERVWQLADAALSDMSWDTTWKLMEEKIRCAV
ncbi:glycosyltransferase family 1 protein [Vreelandella populi]|uniref:Glycosyltransferase family 1 protein n=2 Tax=Vreelandella populi TaxID=2498858 RepID=A0A3S0WIA1_9GAMM|nr:glycosyltransferase family 1 protein [Halomonas populi]RUR44310.1 glycosyltransferase family 1 protein [Halomonas populi]